MITDMNVNRFVTHSLNDVRILRILSAALQAVDPAEAVRTHLPELSGNVYGLGIGKASIPMLTALAEAYPLSGALAISKHASDSSRNPFPVLIGGHPIPDTRSLYAGERVLEFVSSLSEEDLLVCLISGGGSALVTAPYEGITLEDLQALTALLLSCGARIDEINTLRRQLDRIKGGGLLRATKAKVISLILSDVISNPLEAIASGPTFPDPTTHTDASAVLKKYGIEEQVPSSIINHLSRVTLREHSDRHLPPVRAESPSGRNGRAQVPERVSTDSDERLFKSQNIIIGDNKLAAQAAVKQAQEERFSAEILTNDLQGEAREVGLMLAKQLRDEISKRPRPFCLIVGGETTVTIRGKGKGGRNQELALATVDELRNLGNVLLISLATDGDDGPTDAAGAVVTGESAWRAQEAGVDAADHLSRNDAYVFFEKLGDLLKTGPTGTNVNDLIFLFAI